MRIGARGIVAALAAVTFVCWQCTAPAAQSTERFGNLLELSRPRGEHRLLDDLVGEFEFDVRFTLPGEPVSDWRGVTRNQWTIGGRFLRCEATTRREALEVESLRLIGFDPAAKRFQSTSFDSLSLGHVDATGAFDADARTIAFEVESKDPTSGARAQTTEVLRIVDANRYTREIWGRGSAGEPLQLVRAEYRRSR